jgi:hypothetical protein
MGETQWCILVRIIEALHPVVGCCLYCRAYKSEGYNEVEIEFGRGSLDAILELSVAQPPRGWKWKKLIILPLWEPAFFLYSEEGRVQGGLEATIELILSFGNPGDDPQIWGSTILFTFPLYSEEDQI